MKNVFSFALVIFGIFTVAACTRTTVVESKLVPARKGGEKPTDPSKKPAEDKIQAFDKFMIRSLHMNRQSHEVFTELWMHLWEDRMSRPNTVFLDLLQEVEAHRDGRTGHFNEILNQCPEGMSNIATTFKAGSNSEISSVLFRQSDCSSPKNPKWVNAAQLTVQDKNQVRWDIYSQYFPRGAGKHMAADKVRTRCTQTFLDEKRLKALHCEDIGQSRDNETHMVFSKLDFERDGKMLVIAEGKKYKNGVEACDDPKFCTTIKVPAEGAIMILEKIGRGGSPANLPADAAEKVDQQF